MWGSGEYIYLLSSESGYNEGKKAKNPYSRVRNLKKMRHFWANFTDFEPEINIITCKTEKLKEKT